MVYRSLYPYRHESLLFSHTFFSYYFCMLSEFNLPTLPVVSYKKCHIINPSLTKLTRSGWLEINVALLRKGVKTTLGNIQPSCPNAGPTTHVSHPLVSQIQHLIWFILPAHGANQKKSMLMCSFVLFFSQSQTKWRGH